MNCFRHICLKQKPPGCGSYAGEGVSEQKGGCYNITTAQEEKAKQKTQKRQKSLYLIDHSFFANGKREWGGRQQQADEKLLPITTNYINSMSLFELRILRSTIQVFTFRQWAISWYKDTSGSTAEGNKVGGRGQRVLTVVHKVSQTELTAGVLPKCCPASTCSPHRALHIQPQYKPVSVCVSMHVGCLLHT